jgi:hypothetical protein
MVHLESNLSLRTILIFFNKRKEFLNADIISIKELIKSKKSGVFTENKLCTEVLWDTRNTLKLKVADCLQTLLNICD